MNDLLIRNLRQIGENAADLLIRDGRIAGMAPGVHVRALAIETAGGAIAIPALVEAHTHLDKTVMGMDWYEITVATGGPVRLTVKGGRVIGREGKPVMAAP